VQKIRRIPALFSDSKKLLNVADSVIEGIVLGSAN
jgi:hypothetical protein